MHTKKGSCIAFDLAEESCRAKKLQTDQAKDRRFKHKSAEGKRISELAQRTLILFVACLFSCVAEIAPGFIVCSHCCCKFHCCYSGKF